MPWLGKIPGHWRTGPGFAAFREKQVKNTGMREKQVLSLSYGKIVVKPLEKLHGLVPDSFETYQIVDPGDIIIRSTDLQNDWTSLRVGLVRDRGIITSAYLCFKTTGTLIPEYGYLLLHACDLMKVFYGMGSGLRQNLSFLDFKRMLIFVPPPDEQAGIVHFLYHANRRIDRFIRTKKKVIALLNEQKQAIIHRAVTRGLDPNAPLKPSGMPWLGEVPRHWELAKLRRICFYQEGPGLRTWQFTASGIQVICVTNITADGIDLEAYGRYISRDEYETQYRHFTVERNDLLLASSGNSWGKIAEFTGDKTVILNTSTIRLNPTRFGKITSDFLKLVLSAEYVRLQLQVLLTGSCQPNFGPSHLNRIMITFPAEKATQEAIVSTFRKEVAPLGATITGLGREIELLREYRTRLISDIVTGKLDVREAAANLPDDPDAGSTDEPAGIAELDQEEAGDEEMETVSEETDA